MRRELAEGRRWEREEISRDEARRRFEQEGEPYKVELVDTAEGDDLALHAGRLHRPLPRPAPAELEADQGAQADRPRRRVLARRREEPAADPDLRDGLLLAGRSRRAPRAAGGGAASATTAGSARSSTSSTSPSTRPARRSGTRRASSSGTRWRTLRARENPQRGYVEVRTPLMWDEETFWTSRPLPQVRGPHVPGGRARPAVRR